MVVYNRNCVSNYSKAITICYLQRGGIRMLKELLELTKTTETVSDNAVEGVEGKVVNYDCDPMCPKEL